MNKPNSMEQVLDQIALFNYSFLDKIKGAFSDEIRELESIIKNELPPVYKDFLSYMGRSMGDLVIYKLDFNIIKIIDFCKEAAWFPPKRFTLIALEDSDPYADAYLEFYENPEPRVVRFPTEYDPKSLSEILQKRLSVVEPTLPDLIFRFAFVQFYMSQFSVKRGSGVVQKKSPEYAAVDDLFRKLKFERHNLSNNWSGYYTRADAVCFFHCHPKSAIDLKIAGRNERDINHIGEIVLNNLGIRMEKT